MAHQKGNGNQPPNIDPPYPVALPVVSRGLNPNIDPQLLVLGGPSAAVPHTQAHPVAWNFPGYPNPQPTLAPPPGRFPQVPPFAGHLPGPIGYQQMAGGVPIIPRVFHNVFPPQAPPSTPPPLKRVLQPDSLATSTHSPVSPKKKKSRKKADTASPTKAPAPVPAHVLTAQEKASGQLHWPDEDSDCLLHSLIDPDSTFVDKPESFNANPSHAYKKVADAKPFSIPHTADAVKSHFEHMQSWFKAILDFESFTGGAGDADDEDESIDDRLMNYYARRQDASRITAELYNKWKNRGWYTLFFNRYKSHPNFQRSTEYNSRTALTPCKEQSSKKTDSSDAEELPTSPVKTKDPTYVQDVWHSRGETYRPLCQ